MARVRKRVAAGTVLFAAAVALGPGVAAAPADPGHGGSSQRSADGRHDGPRDNQGKGARGDRGRPADRDGRRGHVPKGRGDVDSTADARATSTTGSQATARGVTAASETATAPTSTAPSLVAAETLTVAGGAAVASVLPIAPPAAVVGNGRTPGLLSTGAEAPVRSPAAVIAPGPDAPVPAAPIVLAPLPPTAIQPLGDRAPLPWVVSRIWSPIGPADDDNVLIGLAGLILIPLAGVWLGYRQALAVRAADDLVDR